MKPLVDYSLIMGLFLIFALITVSGITITINSIQPPFTVAQNKGTDSTVDIPVSLNDVKIKYPIAVSGIIIFLLGATGLLLLTLKVPVKQIVGYTIGYINESTEKEDPLDRGPSGIGPGDTIIPELSSKTERIPLFFWWWWKLRGKNAAVRVESET